MENLTTFLSDGSIGDIWASLPSVREYYRKTGKRAIYYLTGGRKAFYYEGATHPTRDPETNAMVMLNDEMINMIIPLLEAQEYIEQALKHNDEQIHVNLNMIRETFVNMPYHSLSKWYHYCFPDLACDLSEKWMEVPETETDFAKGKIIVGRTERYLNQRITYSFLKKYEEHVLFAGTQLEHLIFNARFGLNVKRLQITNFLELAQAVKQAKLTLSNQTQLAQIAEGTKSPRIVELCSFAPNVDFIGENAFEFYAQEAVEYYVDYLWKK